MRSGAVASSHLVAMRSPPLVAWTLAAGMSASRSWVGGSEVARGGRGTDRCPRRAQSQRRRGRATVMSGVYEGSVLASGGEPGERTRSDSQPHGGSAILSGVNQAAVEAEVAPKASERHSARVERYAVWAARRNALNGRRVHTSTSPPSGREGWHRDDAASIARGCPMREGVGGAQASATVVPRAGAEPTTSTARR